MSADSLNSTWSSGPAHTFPGHLADIVIVSLRDVTDVVDAQEICRKLQKDNKQIREASQKLASTEAAIRCESRTQVDATLASISAK